jgi:hypothetical protein
MVDKRVVGAFGDGVHLFPFRTEQLSPSAPMVLGQMSRESRSVPTQFNKMPRCLRTAGHFCFYPCPILYPDQSRDIEWPKGSRYSARCPAGPSFVGIKSVRCKLKLTKCLVVFGPRGIAVLPLPTPNPDPQSGSSPLV